MTLSIQYNIHQALVILYLTVMHFAIGKLFKKLLGTFNFFLLHRVQFSTFICSFGFSNKIYVLNFTLFECCGQAQELGFLGIEKAVGSNANGCFATFLCSLARAILYIRMLTSYTQ